MCHNPLLGEEFWHILILTKHPETDEAILLGSGNNTIAGIASGTGLLDATSKCSRGVMMYSTVNASRSVSCRFIAPSRRHQEFATSAYAGGRQIFRGRPQNCAWRASVPQWLAILAVAMRLLSG